MELGLTGKTALVTGASKGIGRAIADKLATEGCALHLAARSRDALDAAAEEISAAHGVAVKVHALDLGTSAGVDALGAACRDVDILVNNAGAVRAGRLLDIDEAAWREMWDLKLFGYINLTRHVYGAMVARGAGVILNVIGLSARLPHPGRIAVSGCNAALEAFTVALGKESPAHGIRVLGIHPYGTRTERLEQQWRRNAEAELGDAERWRELVPPYPFGRPAEADEIADLAAFLVSDRSAYTSGVVLDFTGGVGGGF